MRDERISVRHQSKPHRSRGGTAARRWALCSRNGVTTAVEPLEGRTLFSAEPTSAIGPATPAGPEFRVNTTTAYAQINTPRTRSVAADADGDFVVTWVNIGQDGNWPRIHAQRYDADGVAQGDEFVVGSGMYNDIASTVAMDDAGNFIVAYVRDDPSDHDGFHFGVFAQRYSAAGVAQGAEFRVTDSIPFVPTLSAAMDGSGNFIIAWDSDGNWEDGSGRGIHVQRYGAGGTPQGGAVRVNSNTDTRKQHPSVAMDGAGNFAVAWRSDAQDGSGSGVYARRYDAMGVAQEDEFRVNTNTVWDQHEPSLSMDDSGNFVVAWTSESGDGHQSGVYARRYDDAGVAQGGEFQVNSYTHLGQLQPSAATDASGNFVVVWSSVGQDGDGFGVYGRQYDAAGVAQGGEFRVNSYTIDWQMNPSAAIDDSGDFVVTWASDGQDGSDFGVYAQRFTAGAAQNLPPVAGAGGPYAVAEGGTIVLTAAATDPDGDVLTFAWDLDDDGTFETQGPAVTFSAAGRDDGSLPVAVRVSDGHNSVTAASTVVVSNVAPTAAVQGPVQQLLYKQQTFAVAATFSDPGTSDTHTAIVDWGDGTSGPADVIESGGSGSVSATHAYSAAGSYAATLRVVDDDSGMVVVTLSATVLETAEAVQNLVDVTQQLLGGVGSVGDATSLTAKLGSLNTRLGQDVGSTLSLLAQLDAFIRGVELKVADAHARALLIEKALLIRADLVGG